MRQLLITNWTDYPMDDIVEYLGTDDKRDTKLFGRLKINRYPGSQCDEIIIKQK